MQQYESKKAGVSISLKFLMGLITTVFLIAFFLGMISKFTGIFGKHYEQDLIDQWADEIKELNENEETYLTQLLPMNNDIKANYLIFIFQVGSKQTLGYSEKTKQYLYKPAKCDKTSCLCSFNTNSNKFEYCRVVGISKISFAGQKYDSEDFYALGNPNLPINAKQGETEIIFPKTIYIKRVRDTINFCFDAVGQQCKVI